MFRWSRVGDWCQTLWAICTTENRHSSADELRPPKQIKPKQMMHSQPCWIVMGENKVWSNAMLPLGRPSWRLRGRTYLSAGFRTSSKGHWIWAACYLDGTTRVDATAIHKIKKKNIFHQINQNISNGCWIDSRRVVFEWLTIECL